MLLISRPNQLLVVWHEYHNFSRTLLFQQIRRDVPHHSQVLRGISGANPALVFTETHVQILDVSVQAQILNLLADLQEKFGLSYVFITHNLDVVRYVSSRVLVMYLGKIVEQGGVVDLYSHPRHPYTASLLSAVPIPNPKLARLRAPIVLEGDVPSPINPPAGCRFHPRCPRAQRICAEAYPPHTLFEAEHYADCHFPINHWPLTKPGDLSNPNA